MYLGGVGRGALLGKERKRGEKVSRKTKKVDRGCAGRSGRQVMLRRAVWLWNKK